MTKKTRVKCANCGMVYDRIESGYDDVKWSILSCPECESNAYDALKKQPENINPEWKQDNG